MSSTESPASGTPGRRRKPAGAAPSGEGRSEERANRARGSRRKGGGRRSGKRGPIVPVLLGVLGLAVVGLVVVLLLDLLGPGATAGEAMPTRYEVYDSGEASEVLPEREMDPRPLNEEEVFGRGNAEITGQGMTFALASQSLSENCSEAVWGDKAAAALAEADCSQAARAGYASDDYVALATLFKLRDIDAAKAVAAALEPVADEDGAEQPGFLVPPTTDAPFDVLGAGFSSAEATVNGHYLIIIWVQSIGSQTPEDTEDLSSPLIALNVKFDMPVLYRVGERENFLGEPETDTEAGTGAEAGTETGADPGAEAGTEGATG
ncbi:hypothetical protein [Nocardiopsis ansamitocini]|uniref:Uncharacterized protein n=1 Tax=Nocardiopsis ansamitocini TaxID=1670832 RepID=A0A9W6UH30_9ACTN|nr:hypothetical protein [Nocardiopsis ansamitocini]GLU45918.1 hypothetical protein Nans01_02690 [Nocardiopsis ansamitocini]